MPEMSSPAAKGAAIAEDALRVKRLSPNAVLPVKGSVHAAGFDLAAAEPITIPAGGKGIAKTGLAIAIPEGTYARIAPRSGLAAKKMIACGAGVVDYDYRGEVGVVLFNHGPEEFVVAQGDRVAQLILEQCSMVGCQEVESLEETARGAGGFGSTGVSEAPGAMPAPAAPVAASSQPEAQSMRVKRTRPNASMPVRGSSAAAGFDLAAAEAYTVKAGGKAIVMTGLSIAIPSNTYARIAPRSGLAAKKMIQVGAGVVDYDYRGEVGVVLFNHGPEDFEIAVGDRVAQLILEKVAMGPAVEVDTLEETERGAGGFGSTGVSEQVGHTPQPLKRMKMDAISTPVKGDDAGEVAALRREVQALKETVAALAGLQGDKMQVVSPEQIQASVC